MVAFLASPARPCPRRAALFAGRRDVLVSAHFQARRPRHARRSDRVCGPEMKAPAQSRRSHRLLAATARKPETFRRASFSSPSFGDRRFDRGLFNRRLVARLWCWRSRCGAGVVALPRRRPQSRQRATAARSPVLLIARRAGAAVLIRPPWSSAATATEVPPSHRLRPCRRLLVYRPLRLAGAVPMLVGRRAFRVRSCCHRNATGQAWG